MVGGARIRTHVSDQTGRLVGVRTEWFGFVLNLREYLAPSHAAFYLVVRGNQAPRHAEGG